MTALAQNAPLVSLRKAAQELSAQRKERFSTIHLLAVAAQNGSPSSELFADRRLDEEAILKAARGISDEGSVAIGRAMTAAREIAKRSGTPEPSALHLVLALLADRSSAAHRALIDLGVDVSRMRAAAMQVALGVVATRRPMNDAPRKPATLPPSAVSITDARRSTTRSESPSPAPVSKNSPSQPPPAPSSWRPMPPGVTVPLWPPPAAKKSAPKPAQNAAECTPIPAPAPLPKLPTAPKRVAPAPAAPIALPASSAATISHIALSRFELDPASFPVLAALGKNLCLAAARGELKSAIGRTKEIEGVLDVLAKRHASSACITGPAGVGKTTVVHGVAHRLVALSRTLEAPRLLIEVSVPELIAGTGLRGALAEKVASICNEVRQSKGSVILFFDEIHELCSPATEEATAALKLALSRGEVHIVGATTPENYRKNIESDPALARRFSIVEVDEPSETEAVPLLKAVAADLCTHHRAGYDDDAIAAAAAWCVRYLPGRALPDKAIGVLDLAGARVRRRASDRAATCRVGMSDVAAVVSELSEVPRERLLETDGDRMLGLEKILAERVVGHSDALSRMARVLRRNAVGIRGTRPIGSFLLLGPTGVGKTETAKAVAEALFHSQSAMTRLDLSEFAEPHALARLVGAPPGYVGHEAGGQLTEAVRKRPYQVVLLDEIEKAHRDVLLAFLQVLDEGHMTDGRGRRVDFTNTVIVLTSNLGSAEMGAAQRERPMGFGRSSAAPRDLSNVMIAAARGALAPELYNRIDEVLCFGALSRAEVSEIASRMIAALGRSLEPRGIRLDVEPAAVEALLDAGGYDITLGARPIRRTIARLIEAPLAEMILRGDLTSGSVALIDVENDQVIVDAVPARAAE
ncbi:MAG: ATP-dependent Clp protease ATP-binding subunit [Polyangiaceae bacterium]|nr:ATP-dependent Clp protease ATP-binding subunit [Polyangiaceae bacterium]